MAFLPAVHRPVVSRPAVNAVGSGLLAATGGNVGMLGGAGLLAVTLGGLAYAIGRRREESNES